MSAPSAQSANRRRLSWTAAQAILFFFPLAAYVWAGIDPRLIYHWQGPVFYTYPDFAAQFAGYPGGWADYAYALIAQIYHWRVGGSVMLSVEIGVVCALAALLLSGSGQHMRALLTFAPAFFLLYHANLYYDSAPLRISLILGLGLAAAFARLLSLAQHKGILLAVFAAFLAVSYYLTALGMIFFTAAAVCVLWSQPAPAAPRRSRWMLTAAFLGLAAALPAVVETFRLTEIHWPASGWFASSDPRRLAVLWALYVWCVAAMAAALWCGARAGAALADRVPPNDTKDRTRVRKGRDSRKPPAGSRVAIGRVAPYLITSALLVALGAVMVISYRLNARDRRLAALDYYVWTEDWPAALAAARRLRPEDFNRLSRYQVNLTLHELGRLGDEMFHYPQSGGPLLELEVNSFLPYMLHLTKMCLRLGRVNEAEHFGSEALVLRDGDPRVYRLLALVYLVKGQTEAARKFLTVLSHSLVDRKWASSVLNALSCGGKVAADAEIEKLQRRMQRTDDMLEVWQRAERSGPDIERLLLDQLDQDPSNRMAFEFLMAFYLLNRDLEGFQRQLPRIHQMSGPGYVRPDGRRRMPRHYQEALAVYYDAAGRASDEAADGIEAETASRMLLFKSVLARAGGRHAGMIASREGFAETYFYYFAFGENNQP